MIEISLTKGFVAIIDDIDSDLSRLNWCVRTQSNYASRASGGRKNHKCIYMHRVILERMLERSLTLNEHVDHINGNVRDNRRSNLRLSDHYQNMKNQKRNKANTTGFKGVSYNNSAKNPYRAYIVLNGKQIHLGVFSNPEDAHQAYCEAAKKYHGEFARFE